MNKNKNLISERKTERNRIYDLKITKWYFDNMEMKTDGKSVSIQLKNSKLQPTDKIAFLIFSLPAVITCPNATKECMHFCYARRDERFPNVRNVRLRNFLISKKDNFVEIMVEEIRNKIYTKKGNLRKAFQNKKIVFRLHESGDFYCVEYMKKWFEIAKHFPEIQFFTYTKSFQILEKCISEKPSNFFIRGSVWNDTTETELKLIEKLALTTYTAAEKIENVPKKNICNCIGGCGGCGCKCAFLNENIVTEIH